MIQPIYDELGFYRISSLLDSSFYEPDNSHYCINDGKYCWAVLNKKDGVIDKSGNWIDVDEIEILFNV